MKSHSDARRNADDTITYWDSLCCEWKTCHVFDIPDRVIDTLSDLACATIDQCATDVLEDIADREDCDSGRVVREYE